MSARLKLLAGLGFTLAALLAGCAETSTSPAGGAPTYAMAEFPASVFSMPSPPRVRRELQRSGDWTFYDTNWSLMVSPNAQDRVNLVGYDCIAVAEGPDGEIEVAWSVGDKRTVVFTAATWTFVPKTAWAILRIDESPVVPISEYSLVLEDATWGGRGFAHTSGLPWVEAVEALAGLALFKPRVLRVLDPDQREIASFRGRGFPEIVAALKEYADLSKNPVFVNGKLDQSRAPR